MGIFLTTIPFADNRFRKSGGAEQLHAAIILIVGILLLAENLPESWNIGLKMLSVVIGATTFFSAIINIRKHYKIKRTDNE